MKEDNVTLYLEGKRGLKAMTSPSCLGKKSSNRTVTLFLFENALVICEKEELPGKFQYIYDSKLCLKTNNMSAISKNEKTIELCSLDTKKKLWIECQDQSYRDLFLTYLKTALESFQEMREDLANPVALKRKETLRRRLSVLIQ